MRKLTAADILPAEIYANIRDKRRHSLIELKRRRRLAVGPYATLYFENYDTMWSQVQEMLRIEKGGVGQIVEELKVYNPMIPNGLELTATVMFEIEDPITRLSVLASLGGVENTIELRFSGESVRGKPEQDLDYTSSEGKASSVQFVHFNFSEIQVKRFSVPNAEVIVAITHKNYSHMAVIPTIIHAELIKDFDPL